MMNVVAEDHLEIWNENHPHDIFKTCSTENDWKAWKSCGFLQYYYVATS